MMHSIDHEGRLISVNDFWLRKLGYERPEVLGRRSTEFLTEESQRYAKEVVLPEFFKSGVCEHVPYQMLAKGGEVLEVLLSATAERDAQGQIVMSRAMIFDVSEIHRAQQEREILLRELEQKNTELERFTYTISHDLKSPLITIQGFLGFLLEDARAGKIDQVEKGIQRISSTTSKMAVFLDELLELSRIGQVALQTERVHLTELAQEACELLSAQIAEANLDVEIATDLPTVRCDRIRMVEVFQNLLSNAIKFSDDDQPSRIEVGRRGEGPETICFVRDDGIGIEPRFHEKIFEIFERLEPQASDGSGIGLALVQRIIEAHGGQIWVESEGVGNGSTFCFTLAAETGGSPDASADA